MSLLCVCVLRRNREKERGDIYEHFFSPVLFRTANEESRTDVLIGLHASLEVRTRDDLCGSMFA